MEQIFSNRGINIDYTKRILKANKRIWAIGMTNTNVIKNQLEHILSRISSESIDIIFSFWAPDSSFKKEYKSTKEISIINQQLHIEDGKVITSGAILSKYDTIIQGFEKVNLKKGKLSIVEMTLPSNFTCFVIDNDVFFFPFLSTVESTSSPTILCKADRGIGEAIFKHIKNIVSNEEVTRVVYPKPKIKVAPESKVS